MYAVRMSSQVPVQSKYIPPVMFYFIFSQIFTLLALAWFSADFALRTSNYIPGFMTWFGGLLRKLFNKAAKSAQAIPQENQVIILIYSFLFSHKA